MRREGDKAPQSLRKTELTICGFSGNKISFICREQVGAQHNGKVSTVLWLEGH